MDSNLVVSELIRVRPITMEDTDMVVMWRANPRVINNFLYRGPFTADIHRKWMETKVASGEVVQFIIEECEVSEAGCEQEAGCVNNREYRPVGSVYFRDLNKNDMSAEYGIFIGEDDAVGHGVGNQIAAWAVKYARDVLELKTLRLRALADNVSAVKSYENAGYVAYDKTENFMDGRDLIFMKVDFDRD